MSICTAYYFDTYQGVYNTYVMCFVMCLAAASCFYHCAWYTVKLSGCSNKGTIRMTLAQVQGHPISSRPLPAFSPYACSQRITYEWKMNDRVEVCQGQ
jgi:hypothetical protein